MPLIRPAIETLEDSPIVEVWRMGYNDPEVIGMFAGEPDVPTPQFIRDAAVEIGDDAVERLARGGRFCGERGEGFEMLRIAIAQQSISKKGRPAWYSAVVLVPPQWAETAYGGIIVTSWAYQVF